MNRTTWFHRSEVQRRRAARCRPQVERLEDRTLMSFQVLATLGDPVSLPTGPAFRINDFEPNALNNQGDVLYGDDLGIANDPSTFFGEGVFLRNSHGQETVLGNSTAPAPGGGIFDFGFLGPSSLNDQGDAAFVFLLQPAGSPIGVNAGTYRFSHSTDRVTPVVVPGVTPAPRGGVFVGTNFNPSLNNRGDLVFSGIVPTDKGIHVPGEPYVGLGAGLFAASATGHISTIVSPGDAAPGGGAFDYATEPWINDRGDIAFEGHIAGEPSQIPGFPPQAVQISALTNLYVRDGATGQITTVVRAGDPAPGGGSFRQALGPVMNNRGDIAFLGDLTPAPDANQVNGVFLYSNGKIIPIARPGDAMPGGGHFVTGSFFIVNQYHVNNQGDVVFNAVLDTDVLGLGTQDTGLFQWSHGQLSLLARTGTVIPGVGTVLSLSGGEIGFPPPPMPIPTSGAINNDQGQVLFSAALEDGRNVMLLYTPAGSRHGAAQGPLVSLASPVDTARLDAALLSTLVQSLQPAAGQSRLPAYTPKGEPGLSGGQALGTSSTGQKPATTQVLQPSSSTLAEPLRQRATDQLFTEAGHFTLEDALGASADSL